MPKLTVNVEQRHIDTGLPQSPDQCPIAKALKEQHPREERWLVYLSIVALWPGRPIPMPEKAAKFSRDFYDGKPVKPFTFELEV